MCLWDRTYFESNQIVTFLVQCLKVSNAGFYCHLKVKLYLYYETRVTSNGCII